MSMVRLIIAIFAFLFAGLSTIKAQQASFASQLLAKLAKDINYQPVDTLKEGCYKVNSVLGKDIIAEYDTAHVVNHLGIKLFNPQMKKDLNPLVYNFLERYFLELYCWKDKHSLQQKLNDDKVYFTKGQVADFGKVKENSLFSVSRVENKYYEVSWKRTASEAPFLAIAFPVQYELLLGMPQVEIEKTMHERIIQAPAYTESFKISKTTILKDSVYMTAPKKFYELPDVNTCCYFKKNVSNQYQLICDSIYTNYTATNLFHLLTKANNPIKIEQSIYGFKKLEYVVSLKQWLNYCHAENLTVYTAVETEYDNGTKVLVIAENKDLGYNHVLSVIVPKAFLSSPTLEFPAKLNAFITTHNVKNLYEKYKKGPKKIF